jgi:hypothetical protein
VNGIGNGDAVAVEAFYGGLDVSTSSGEPP